MSLIYRSVNLNDQEKSEKLIQQENHLAQVKEERALYQKMVGKATVKQLEVNGLQTGAPNSRPVEMHYSLDYTQQVHLPSTVKARYNDMFGFRQIGRCNEFVSVMNLAHNAPTDRHDGDVMIVTP
ncbi:hypothetical protein CAPTEDRAFT_212930 [Capitella teleta]|uniref:Uncharacterized protein n=1 Tax=Capitella teleta TaxID=283909 RepID=R7V1Q1_CAPTE|nr:hypothetical protein CAPTEDRAFT_212930 [Capitella teleta]|eukprot:ELU10246.1 hypothetical protein CAPTEDRAFT_212930 [Capitella teleta]